MCFALACIQNDIMVGLYTRQVQIQPKYMTFLNDSKYVLEFEEVTQIFLTSREFWSR